MPAAQVIRSIRRKFRALRPGMDERLRRQWAAAQARELGRGGVTAVACATGMSRTTITVGGRELELPIKQREQEALRVRRPGGGRRSLAQTDPDLLAALEALVEPVTRGDPESPLRKKELVGDFKNGGREWRPHGQPEKVRVHDFQDKTLGKWKLSLQGLADDLGLKLFVCHFPPGTSKWNKIEHRMFSFITQNWRGKPLVSHQAIVNLIAGTTTRTGLIVEAALDTNHYDTKIKVSKAELANVRLAPHKFHGEWNYTISPRK